MWGGGKYTLIPPVYIQDGQALQDLRHDERCSVNYDRMHASDKASTCHEWT